MCVCVWVCMFLFFSSSTWGFKFVDWATGTVFVVCIIRNKRIRCKFPLSFIRNCCCFHLVTVSITSFHAVNVNGFYSLTDTYSPFPMCWKSFALWLRGKLIKFTSFHNNLLQSLFYLSHRHLKFILCTCSWVLSYERSRKLLEERNEVKFLKKKAEMCLFENKNEQLPCDIGQRLG